MTKTRGTFSAIFGAVGAALSYVTQGRSVSLPEESPQVLAAQDMPSAESARLEISGRNLEMLAQVKNRGQLGAAIRALAAVQDPYADALFKVLKNLSLADVTDSRSAGKAQFSEWALADGIANGMKNSTWVYACLYLLAGAVGSVPWVAEIQRGDKWERAETHPLTQLIQQPNEYWDRSVFFQRLVYSLLLGGEAPIAKVRGMEGEIAELWLHSPDKIGVVPSQTDFISHYEYKAGGQKRRIETTDLIHVLLPDPGNPYRGLSPLRVANRLVQTEVKAVEWNYTSIENRAVVDGIYAFQFEMSDSQYETARKRIDSMSGPRNGRGSMVMDNGVKWQPMSLSPVEMDFINSQKLTRETICAIFGVPPVLVGILDRATYSNYPTARKIFWMETVVPLLDSLQSALNAGLAAEFSGSGGTVRLRYDVAGIQALQAIDEGRIQNALALHGIGVPLSVLNTRFSLGLPEIEGDQVPYVGGVPVVDGLPITATAAMAGNAEPLQEAVQAMREAKRKARLDEAEVVIAQIAAVSKRIIEAPQGQVQQGDIERLDALQKRLEGLQGDMDPAGLRKLV